MVAVHQSVANLYSQEFLERVAALRVQVPVQGLPYYLADLSADVSGQPSLGWNTHWIGYTESRPRREIRKVSRVDPVLAVQSLREFGRPALVVNKPQDFIALMMFGGSGVVAEAVGLFFYPDLLEPMEMARDSSGLGYVGVKRMPGGKLKHAPAKRLRMQIIKRDRGRCVICGRSPFEDVTIELHVHHIIPWGRGGLTETENLATLCHTCHGGLDLHDDSFVRERVQGGEKIDAGYEAQLTRYQQANRPFLEEPAT